MMKPRSLKLFASIALVAAFASAGCATTGPLSESDEEVASASEAASEGKRGHEGREGKFGHPRGGHELLFVALKELDLSAEQRKTIEGAIEKLGDKEPGGMAAVHKALADGVRAGKIDEAAVKAKMGEIEQKASARRADAAKALETLHATLTPEQRDELVSHIEERMQKHPRMMGGRDKGDHERRGPMGARGPQGRGGEKGAMHGPMGHLLRGLDLREEQRTAIASKLEAQRPDKPSREEMEKKHEEMRARAEATLRAFRSDKFDAEAALPEKMGEGHIGHLVTALGAIVPVLDEGQRAELAKRLEEGPRHPHMGGRGRGKRGEAHEAPAAR
ncbi:Spy/CpxP family protein refolding chaperone [Polyangium aurulentum]|uniref:Spy/CpxP family protein refolding chaperone n=1 Tax=Polyangium aurulentum TaxID=2567896 RepID=UPI001469EC4B|nr:Spy/CpxP family protein refolding chaperone [Polyangium aurulentum]UQA63024.1 Spy/CpxP family protein refolding chaperone [Polyangium aurulentum]